MKGQQMKEQQMKEQQMKEQLRRYLSDGDTVRNMVSLVVEEVTAHIMRYVV